MTKDNLPQSAVPRYVAPEVRLFRMTLGRVVCASASTIIDDWGSGATIDFGSNKGSSATIDDWQDGTALNF